MDREEAPKHDRSTARAANPIVLVLNIFAEVRAGEGLSVVLLFLNIFLILTAYYVLKVVREALAISGIELFGIEGDEAKAYLPAVMAVLLVGIVPAYGRLASAVDRLRLIASTMIIVALGLLLFFVWGSASGVGSAIGLAFYIFLGIVNVFLIAQFWSYANDIYSEDQGKRLFAIIAIGQSLGAVLGPKIASAGADVPFVLLALSGGTLLLCLGLYLAVNRLAASKASGEDAFDQGEPLKEGGGFSLVLSNRYLLYIALMILCTNVVNTTGEYILSNAAKTKAENDVSVSQVVAELHAKYRRGSEQDVPEAWRSYFATVPQTADSQQLGNRVDANVAAGTMVLSDAQKRPIKDARSPVIGRFYGDFFFLVNLVGLLVQMFIVSRIFKFFGVRAALFVLPVVAFAGYAAIGILGGLLVLRAAKTAENSLDYSLQNTVKQALFLPTSREAKYKAKAAIDTFFVRFGDAASAGLVALGLHVARIGAKEFALLNVVLCCAWIVISLGIAREHRKLSTD